MDVMSSGYPMMATAAPERSGARIKESDGLLFDEALFNEMFDKTLDEGFAFHITGPNRKAPDIMRGFMKSIIDQVGGLPTDQPLVIVDVAAGDGFAGAFLKLFLEEMGFSRVQLKVVDPVQVCTPLKQSRVNAVIMDKAEFFKNASAYADSLSQDGGDSNINTICLLFYPPSCTVQGVKSEFREYLERDETVSQVFSVMLFPGGWRALSVKSKEEALEALEKYPY